VYEQEALQVPELRNGEVAGHHRLQHKARGATVEDCSGRLLLAECNSSHLSVLLQNGSLAITACTKAGVTTRAHMHA